MYTRFRTVSNGKRFRNMNGTASYAGSTNDIIFTIETFDILHFMQTGEVFGVIYVIHAETEVSTALSFGTTR
jgi:hypothetical protein